MANGRSRSLWDHTSHLMALIANVNRDPKKKPIDPSVFNPHPEAAVKKAGVGPKQKISAFKRSFLNAGLKVVIRKGSKK